VRSFARQKNLILGVQSSLATYQIKRVWGRALFFLYVTNAYLYNVQNAKLK